MLYLIIDQHRKRYKFGAWLFRMRADRPATTSAKTRIAIGQYSHVRSGVVGGFPWSWTRGAACRAASARGVHTLRALFRQKEQKNAATPIRTSVSSGWRGKGRRRSLFF